VKHSKQKHILFLIFIALSGWIIPGAGHVVLKEYKRAVIILITIILTFWPWFIAQFMASPAVGFIGEHTAPGGYLAYGKPNEIGQIYTSTAGLLNLLCIVNAVYIARMRWLKSGDSNVA
jgi:hypothetical protein